MQRKRVNTKGGSDAARTKKGGKERPSNMGEVRSLPRMQPVLTLDQWLQIWFAEKVARELGMDRVSWQWGPGGIIISMGKSNADNS